MSPMRLTLADKNVWMTKTMGLGQEFKSSSCEGETMRFSCTITERVDGNIQYLLLTGKNYDVSTII